MAYRDEVWGAERKYKAHLAELRKQVTDLACPVIRLGQTQEVEIVPYVRQHLGMTQNHPDASTVRLLVRELLERGGC